ncbi:hypothetical protein IW261DRAFT_1426709 [Armillaria novae-zelandiae]|uniref:Centrosomin N-terminal motif 1 domain-containing protein n=1 Tax=Armillaria novae-zelandiae TaxID=153914 RepID=A0AA39NJL3_9AGAR|nr:hypothetical protein IW261DRAFT_1426709 [Armillaria novae-zelandiae]
MAVPESNIRSKNLGIKSPISIGVATITISDATQMDAALKQNIDLKLELSARGQEIKRLKKLLLELERELERIQCAVGWGRERELEEKLEEWDRKIRELRRRQNGHGHEAEDDAG